MNFENILVKVDKPYPKIENANDDKLTVAVLKNLILSRGGELTATLQYMFQSVVAGEVNAEISDILEEIAIVEMMHIEMLMQAIKTFGGVPKYQDAQGVNFNSGFVYGSTKLKEMLDANIMGEQKAIEDYTNAINKVGNLSLKNLFKRIIEDEQLHIKVFKTIKNNVEFLSI